MDMQKQQRNYSGQTQFENFCRSFNSACGRRTNLTCYSARAILLEVTTQRDCLEERFRFASTWFFMDIRSVVTCRDVSLHTFSTDDARQTILATENKGENEEMIVAVNAIYAIA